MHTELVLRVHHPGLLNDGIFARHGHTIQGSIGRNDLPSIITDDFFRDCGLPSFLFFFFKLGPILPLM